MDPNTYPNYREEKSFFDRLGGYFIEFIETVVVFVAIFFMIYLFVAQFHKVSGNSMIPTFHNGDYIITEKVSYRFGTPKRGDIIVLKNPKDESQDFIKRIIALPHDTMRLENNTIFVNDVATNETYLPAGTKTEDGSFLSEGQTIRAGPNQYFVMGDNREHSSDSREWGGVTKKEIIGKTFFRYWPPQSIGFVNDK